MINRSELLEEEMLREYIRHAIRIVQEKRNKEEAIIRTLVRQMINEAQNVFYEYTTLNKLADAIVSTVSGATETSKTPFKQQYMSLTSDPGERAKLVEYIIDFAEADFNLLSQGKEPRVIPSDFVEMGFEEERPEEEEEKDLVVSIDDLNDAGGDVLEPDTEDNFLGEDSEDSQESIDQSTLLAAREAYKSIGPALQKAWNTSPTEKIIPKEVVVEVDGKETVFPPNSITEGDLLRIYFPLNLRLQAEKFEQEMTVDQGPDSEIDQSFDGLGI